jgi:hypothetical protein
MTYLYPTADVALIGLVRWISRIDNPALNKFTPFYLPLDNFPVRDGALACHGLFVERGSGSGNLPVNAAQLGTMSLNITLHFMWPWVGPSATLDAQQAAYTTADQAWGAIWAAVMAQPNPGQLVLGDWTWNLQPAVKQDGLLLGIRPNSEAKVYVLAFEHTLTLGHAVEVSGVRSMMTASVGPGAVINVVVQACTLDGDNIMAGGATVTASAHGPDGSPGGAELWDVAATDNGDGTYSVAIPVTQSGSYVVTGKIGGLDIGESPQPVEVVLP